MDDILFCILSHLNIKDIHNCMLTTKQFNKIASQNLIWKGLFDTNFHNILNDIPSPTDYHTGYKSYNTLMKLCRKSLDYPNIMNVNTFSIAGPKLQSIPPEICLLHKLTCLDANNNRLMTIPKEISLLTNLKQLYLHGNKLKSINIPDEIYTLSELRNLSFTGNPMEEISPKICQLKKLETLYVSSTLLKSLPKELGNLYNLRQIFAIGNNLKSVPMEICSLDNLKYLSLEHNPLDMESESIKLLLQLKKICYTSSIPIKN